MSNLQIFKKCLNKETFKAINLISNRKEPIRNIELERKLKHGIKLLEDNDVQLYFNQITINYFVTSFENSFKMFLPLQLRFVLLQFLAQIINVFYKNSSYKFGNYKFETIFKVHSIDPRFGSQYEYNDYPLIQDKIYKISKKFYTQKLIDSIMSSKFKQKNIFNELTEHISKTGKRMIQNVENFISILQ
uniref:Uncharacterized protein n=1 Tax=Parastrongyloides trichosuri TaxID=131310 RepID=A0A0N5A4F1_PARTI